MISLIVLGLIIVAGVGVAAFFASRTTASSDIMENTSKNFALQLGALVSLYVSIGALITLLFSLITLFYPDPDQFMWEAESASSSVRMAIAVLIVFFPTYAYLTRTVNRIRRTESGTYLMLTKWLIYLSLLIGGGVLLGDLVAVLNSFLNGELTIRFVLKALAVLVVVGGAFAYYLADVRGYWMTHEKESIRYGLVTSVVVVAALALGFACIETPTEVREVNIDRSIVTDLEMIQNQIQSYAYLEGELPTDLEEAYGGLEIPAHPEGRAPYRYERLADNRFELCAEFAYPTKGTERNSYAMMSPEMMIKNAYNWNHEAGEWCFERVVEFAADLSSIKR